MTSNSGSSHVGSSLSCIDILSVLYCDVAQIDPAEPQAADRDIVIVSKGHAAAAVYATLAHFGFFSKLWLDSYSQNGQELGGHVTTHGVPGVELSTGSLGHGLPFAAGVAWSLKQRKSNSKVFVLVSDGELDEGSNWEAALVAAHHNLDNLTVIVDRNGLQSLTTTEETLRLEPLEAKWSSFGWSVSTVPGHNHQVLKEVLQTENHGQPRIVIAETTKGFGVSFMENSVLWHYRPPSPEDLTIALSELATAEAGDA